jgi:hypothetical protein
MRGTLDKLIRTSGGQNLAEYGIALAVVALGVVTAALAIRLSANALWTRALQAIVTAVLGV